MLFREEHMEKLTMLDYVKETPGVLRTNIEQYTALVEPLMKEVVVHLFVNEERQVYNLDRLYSDVPVKTYDL